MRLWVISDLHLDFGGGPLAVPEADVCVCAGDVMEGAANSIHWLHEHVAARGMPVVYVAGNHDFYGFSVFEGLEDARTAARACPGIHFLENSIAEFGGVRFLGATLWTDLTLGAATSRDLAWNMAAAEAQVADYRHIAWRRLPAYEALSADAVQRTHLRSRRFLQGEMGQPRTVVVTHHAPHPGSIHQRWQGSNMNHAFASDLTDLIEAGRPELWVHGHMHDSADYRVGGTRVVCNPKGYHAENGAFDPMLILEV